MTVARIYAAGKVRRWHMNPALSNSNQTNADHQGGCVRLLLMLHPDPSVPLIRAVAHHDDGERWAGDMSAPAKQANRDLADHLFRIERRALERELGHDVFDKLSAAEASWLLLVDRLEAYAHVSIHRRDELARDGWPAARTKLLEIAGFCGVRDAVSGFLDDMDAGHW